MKKKILSVAVLMAALLAAVMPGLVPGVAAKAATGDASGDIGFYVRALLPENQIDRDLTYFDLRVAPGQTQTLEVEVVNESAGEITVDVDAVSASTNRNGVIDYKTPGVRDESLANPFSELAALEKDALTLPAGGSARARVTLSLPEEAYDGIVLGGLVFTRRPGEAAQSAEGATVQNLYSYVIGVKLSENDTPVAPDFELDGVAGGTVNYRPAMVHYIRNRNAAIARDISLNVTLRDADGRVVGEAAHTGVEMAPNSVMPLAVAPDGESGQLAPGDYTTEVTLEQGGRSWTFEQSFTIGGEEARQINAESVGAAAQTGGKLPMSTLLIVLLAVVGAICLVLVLIILLMLRRRQEAKELNRLMRLRQRELRLKKQWAERND